MLENRRFASGAIWLGLWLAVVVGNCGQFAVAQSDDVVQTANEQSQPEANDEEVARAKRNFAPDQFSEVDKLTNLTVLALVVFILGVVALLALIVLGARRMRRMTRSPLLKSKYDELELLREKYRREVDGLETPPPPSRENRR